MSHATVTQSQDKEVSNIVRCFGVLPTATQTEIKDAYYDLALQHHPDQSIDLEADKIFQGKIRPHQVRL